MPLAMPDTELDLTVLEAHEFGMACEHSCHNQPGQGWWHSGDAYYWAKVWHCCPGAKYAHPLIYAICQPAGDWFAARHDKYWTCLRCSDKDLGRTMVEIIGPINP
jgi:hypothetical protein